MLRLTRVALAAGVLTWALPATAGTPRPLVVDVTTMGQAPRKEPIEDFLEDTSSLEPDTYPMVSLEDPSFTEGLRWRMPTQAGTQCQGTPEPLPDIVADARAAWNQLDLDSALYIINTARQDLPCQAAIIDAADLKALLFLEGAVHFFLEDGQDQATFSELAAMFPDAEPEPGFSPEIQQSFRQATAMARQGDDIGVIVSPSISAMSPRLDGQPVPSGSNTVTVKSGRHVAQITGPQEQVRTELFTLFPGFEEDLATVGQLLPDRAQVVGATVRAQITSERVDGLVAEGLSRYATANDYTYLLFVVPNPDGPEMMKVLTLDPETAQVSEGVPADLGELTEMEGDDRPVKPPSNAGGIKPPRSYDPGSVRRPVRLEPTDTRVGGALGVLIYDGSPFVTIEPRYDMALGPVSVAATGILGFGPGSDGLGVLPGLRLGVLKRFYVRSFAPHAGIAYQIIAARVATASGQDILIIEGTPELFGGTEWALNDSGLRLTGRAGVSGTPGLLVLGDETIDVSGRLAISLAFGAAWTW